MTNFKIKALVAGIVLGSLWCVQPETKIPLLHNPHKAIVDIPIDSSNKEIKRILKFKKDYWKIVLMEEEAYGVPREIIFAQAIVEQNAGKGKLAKKANNHFSIKCFIKKCAPGHCIRHGKDKHNRYIVYKNKWESFRAFSLFLRDNPRYASLFRHQDYQSWAVGLKKAGYATDKNYDTKLIDAIQKYHLYEP